MHTLKQLPNSQKKGTCQARRQSHRVGSKAHAVDDGRFLAHILGNGLLKLNVCLAGTANSAWRTGGGAKLLDAADDIVVALLMLIGKSEVVVRAKVETADSLAGNATSIKNKGLLPRANDKDDRTSNVGCSPWRFVPSRRSMLPVG